MNLIALLLLVLSMLTTEKHHKLTFWSMIDDHFVKHHHQIQEISKNCFRSKCLNTTATLHHSCLPVFRLKKSRITAFQTEKKCCEFPAFDGVILQSDHRSLSMLVWINLKLTSFFIKFHCSVMKQKCVNENQSSVIYFKSYMPFNNAVKKYF